VSSKTLRLVVEHGEMKLRILCLTVLESFAPLAEESANFLRDRTEKDQSRCANPSLRLGGLNLKANQSKQFTNRARRAFTPEWWKRNGCFVALRQQSSTRKNMDLCPGTREPEAHSPRRRW